MIPVNIRKGKVEDLEPMLKLFYDTVTTVNTADYNEEQIAVWASSVQHAHKWLNRFSEQILLIAEKEDNIIGYISFTDNGYLDLLYVHKDFQRKGVAQQLYIKIEEYAKTLPIKEITSDVSITARPFFERNNFVVLSEQIVERNGVRLTNFKMKKILN